MKHYICRKCGFSGNRQMVREHLKEEHLIKKGKITTTLANGKERIRGAKTINTITMEAR